MYVIDFKSFIEIFVKKLKKRTLELYARTAHLYSDFPNKNFTWEITGSLMIFS